MEQEPNPTAHEPDAEQAAAPLTSEQARVLASLIEKSYLTPAGYPMTLNAIITACNQKTSRFPVVDLDEETVHGALDDLRYGGWVTMVRSVGARAAKYRHEFRKEFSFTDRDIAVLCVLMLRGPQTAGEIRARSERIAVFDDLGEVEGTLRDLEREFDRPLVKPLPRAPGHKDIRYMHLLCGDEVPEIAPEAAAATTRPAVVEDAGRVEALEKAVAELRAEIDSLQADFAGFRRQFE